MLQRQIHHRADQQRRRQHQRPADHLPAAHLPGQSASLGVAQSAHCNGAKHQQVTGLNAAGTADQCITEHQRTAQCGAGPEGFRRPFMGQPRGIQRHAQRLQTVDQRTVGRRQGLHGPGRQYRETEDHPGHHQRQAFDLLPGRPFFPVPQQQQRRRNRRKQCPAQAVEQRVEFLHDDPREGQGEAEDHNAEQAQGHAGVFARGHDGNQNMG
ncbi:hypothetical protein D3C84_701070 [compost metagenome]